MNSDELLRKAAEALELVPIESVWDDLVTHLGHTLNVDWAFVSKLLPGTETKLQTLAAWHRGRPVQDFEYQLTAPFDDTPAQDLCVHVRDARNHVPNSWLKRVKAESFGQIKLIGSLGQVRGLLGIAHSQPLERADLVEAVLRIYAFKAVIELERELADERFCRQLLDSYNTR